MKRAWSEAPLRRVLRRRRDTNDDRRAPLLSLTIEGTTVLRSGEEGLGQQAPSDGSIANYVLVEPGQLVVNPMWLVGGSIGVATIAGAVSPAYRVYEPVATIEPRFLHHFVRSSQSRAAYRMFGRGETTFDRAVSAEDFESLPVRWPDLHEQRRIADFLDDRVARIDRIIAARREQVTAVTAARDERIRTLITTGDQTSRESGVDWMPLIGSDWPLPRVSHVFRTGSGSTPPSEDPSFYDGGVAWVNTGDIKDGPVTSTKRSLTEKALDAFSTLVSYPEGSLVIAMYGQGATKGRVGLLEIPACVNQACCVLQADRDLTEWAFYWFRAHKAQIVQLAMGSGQPNLSQDIVRALRIPFAPGRDRSRILKQIADEEGPAARVIAALTRQVDLLSEFKSSLITAAVNGELDVRTAGSGIPA